MYTSIYIHTYIEHSKTQVNYAKLRSLLELVKRSISLRLFSFWILYFFLAARETLNRFSSPLCPPAGHGIGQSFELFLSVVTRSLAQNGVGLQEEYGVWWVEGGEFGVWGLNNGATVRQQLELLEFVELWNCVPVDFYVHIIDIL